MEEDRIRFYAAEDMKSGEDFKKLLAAYAVSLQSLDRACEVAEDKGFIGEQHHLVITAALRWQLRRSLVAIKQLLIREIL